MHVDTANIQLNRLDHGIAEIVFCAHHDAVNKLDQATLLQLDDITTTLSQDPQLRGVLLRSSKNSFIVGADINEFLAMFALPDKQLEAWLKQANAIFNRLEDLSVPSIAAINSYALGGGCELVLACDFRIVSNDAQLGLPETKLGIMPGFGGTVRLPRLIGADNAMEWISSANNYSAAQALKVGVVDAIVETEQLHDAALALLHRAISGQFDWQSRRHSKQAPLMLSAIEAQMSFSVAKGLVAAKAGKHYPAPMMAINTIEQAAKHSRNTALSLETKNFIKLTQSPTAHALVRLFLNTQHVKGLSKGIAAQAVQHAAVIGAGIMGGGIAYQSASKGVPVVMKDIHAAALTLGMQQASNLLNKQLLRGKIDGLAMAQILTSITPSLEDTAIRHCDIAIEAVVEDLPVKAAVLKALEHQLPSEALLTSNTSTIPISQLAQHLQRPENFCGMHFFNPVHRMPLVEVIKTSDTAQATVDKVVAYAKQMGKTPIVVNDCPGFFVNRVLFPYFFAFTHLLQDGIDPYRIDRIMEQAFGWPMGPAYLLDVVGIDTAHHASQVMAKGFPERMRQMQPTAIDALFAAKRFGQKSGAGFYLYTDNEQAKPTKQHDSELSTLLAPQPTPRLSIDDDSIMQRMMIPMLNEVVLCLEQGIINSPQEADLALIYGLGFPAFRGGAFCYLDQLGLSTYLQQCDKYSELGPLYQASPTLRQKAEHQQSYYSEE